MSREVRHDGSGALEVRFPYDRELVELIKTLPNRRWNASERFWSVPEADAVRLVDLLRERRFRFDEVTRDVYRSLGGSATLTDEPTAVGIPPVLPGLFDAETDGTAAGPQDHSVSALNQRVKDAIASAFPQAIWLVGEISSFNRNAHKRHVSFQLAEHDEDGKTVSSVDATIFERTRTTIETALARAGDPFRLEDEISVRVLVRVDLYVPWGSYRVVVEDLDVGYTLGEAARRREEIVRRLTEEKLIDVNTSLPFPPLPLRVGLITSLGSDAYNDVRRTLEESGFAFEVTAHGARVQGRATEPSVLNALDVFRERVDELDVVLICRGGGSRTDLAWFDSLALGRAVAQFPLPVVIGIGHEQDHSVLDSVGWRAKTPTAAAAFLVETTSDSLEHVEVVGSGILERALRRIADERRHGSERARRLVLASRGLLERAGVEIRHRTLRVTRGTRALVGSAAERLTRFRRDLPRAATVLLTRQDDFLAGARRSLGPRGLRVLRRESERSDARARRLELVHPRRVVERGYAIMRLDDGTVLTRADRAPRETRVRAELARGELRLRSEGPIEGDGGE